VYVLFVMETQTWAIPAVPIAQSARKSGQITQSAHAPPTLAEVSLAPYVGCPSAQEDQSNHSNGRVVPARAALPPRSG
jgi:hypothetical protein